MTNNNKMDSELKIRCFLEEKELLKKNAEEVGMKMSDFVRSLIFNDKKLILLSDGAEIAKSLFMIHKNLDYFRNSGGIPKETADAIARSLEDVSLKLNNISQYLTDIHSDIEEGNDNE